MLRLALARSESGSGAAVSEMKTRLMRLIISTLKLKVELHLKPALTVLNLQVLSHSQCHRRSRMAGYLQCRPLSCFLEHRHS